MDQQDPTRPATAASPALGRDALLARLADHVGPLEDVARARVVRAPGRVNLIGEHTDYNDGLVLPAAIDLEMRIAYLPTDDRQVRLASGQTGDTLAFDAGAPGPRAGGWRDYVAGTAWAMGEAGLATHGLTGVLESTVPVGAGLSSSAALELASAWALSGTDAPAADPLSLVRVAQRAENDYVGMRCGLMDQFASAAGVAGSAVLLDCRSLEHRAVPIPAGLVLVVAHTGVPRSLTSSAYNERRAQCEAAVAVLARHDPGVSALRDVTPTMLDRYADELEPVVLRRARHVVEEDERVLATERALRVGDLDEVGRLFAASHASLRDLYEVSVPELDALVALAASTPGVVASRMTGAGFGGCTVSLVHAEAVERLRARVAHEYAALTGREPRVWAVRAVAGAGEVVA
ncbi:MAG: galactokinase [Chloroflexota bacterium]